MKEERVEGTMYCLCRPKPHIGVPAGYGEMPIPLRIMFSLGFYTALDLK